MDTQSEKNNVQKEPEVVASGAKNASQTQFGYRYASIPYCGSRSCFGVFPVLAAFEEETEDAYVVRSFGDDYAAGERHGAQSHV